MDLLLDHMLGKKVARLFSENGFDTVRVFELNAHHLQNGELYKLATSQNRVLISCDTDFENNRVGSLGSSSIIYLKPEPDSSLQHLLPMLMSQIKNVPKDIAKDHLIVITNNQILGNKFEQ
ncbi:MAG: hypothetical protein GPJ54_06675 [Candidatus Heimdallarchaeota archaeon]|nr:hypothetical protein [Candidatus Heimdallarchaeota archaeon]